MNMKKKLEKLETKIEQLEAEIKRLNNHIEREIAFRIAVRSIEETILLNEKMGFVQ